MRRWVPGQVFEVSLEVKLLCIRAWEQGHRGRVLLCARDGR